MGIVEDALRDTFEARAARPPVLDDIAGRAIHGAGRTRRRRAMTLTTMAVVALVAAGVAALPDRRHPDRLADPGPTSATVVLPSVVPTAGYDVMDPIPVDLLNGDRLQLTDGRVLMLDVMGTVGGVWRVRDGWLAMSNDTDRSSVWFLAKTGARMLLATGDRAIVSPGTTARPGPQIAWVRGGQLSLARLDGDHLTDLVQTDGVGRLYPLLVVADGVLLGGTGAGGSIDQWDMWFPARGAYRPTPVVPPKVSRVLGATDNRIIALVDGMCLALVDPDAFERDSTNCSFGFGFDTTIYPSPNGAWWLVASQDGLVLYDPVKMWTSMQPVRTWSHRVGSVTWTDLTSFVMSTDTELVRVFLGDPRDMVTTPVPTQRRFKLVPDLRAWTEIQ